jgi:REP element-mobilizing transposase RayT
MGKRIVRIKEVVLASHLVMMGYGHWLPNDPRGSGSSEMRKTDLEDLGDIHLGRKRDQPTRDELREFFREAEPLLDHQLVWFREEQRQSIACAFAKVTKERGYTVWACAILKNHAHLVVRTHKNDRSEEMWHAFAGAAEQALRAFPHIGPNHPVWSARVYKVYLKSRNSVSARIDYVWRNPMKEGLPPQNWDFVSECPWK